MSKLPQTKEETIDERVQRLAREECARYFAALKSGPRVYTQHDRPAWGNTKTLFLSGWRELHDAGHPGVRAVGKVREMSEAASEEYARGHAPKLRIVAAAPSAPRDLETDALAELGAVAPRNVGSR